MFGLMILKIKYYLGVLAYFIRDWRSLQMVSFGPHFFLLLLWFILPESPRWLRSVGKEEQAREILKAAAKCNKAIILDDELHNMQNDNEASECSNTEQLKYVL